MGFFQELIAEAVFPDDYTIGPASETLGMHTGGSAGDWINTSTKMMAAEVEISNWEDATDADSWMPRNIEAAYKNVAEDSWSWLATTFRKLGNQISVKAVGYTKSGEKITGDAADKFEEQILLHMEVTNHGLSDQIHVDFPFSIRNYQMATANNNALAHLAKEAGSKPDEDTYYINGLKARSKQIVKIPINMKKIKDK
jgi:hypothetical protein